MRVGTPRTVLAMSLFIAVTLAGCADEAGEPETIDFENVKDTELKAGKGAISGLLVDDRFRPIHLTDDPQTEFQTTGFVLLQETGQQVQTTENGEFAFIDLDPGQYTLRVTAEGHEAVPQKAQVQEGLFNEVSLVARRMASEGSLIVTEAYAAFATCLPNAIVFSFRLDCSGDRSGESDRTAVVRNWSALPDVTWVVAEALFNQEPKAGASWDVTMRDESFTNDFSAFVMWDVRYGKMHLQHGTVSPDEVPAGSEFVEWRNNMQTSMEMFGRGLLAEEIRTTYEPVYENLPQEPCIPTGLGYCYQELPMRRGIGTLLGIKAQFLINIFVGEPEVDPLTYCALCPS